MTRLLKTLVPELERHGIAPESVARNGGGVWAFGSRAAGCARRDSDWDVLVVTRSRPIRTRVCHGVLDVVRVDFASFLGHWRQTELATHVAAFGVCLAAPRALNIVAVPLAAATRKARVVASRAALVDRLWDAFQPQQLYRELLRLRRDVQRAALLATAQPVPPTAALDLAWSASGDVSRQEVLRTVPLSRRLTRALAE
jgi:hypothetical protein